MTILCSRLSLIGSAAVTISIICSSIESFRVDEYSVLRKKLASSRDLINAR